MKSAYKIWQDELTAIKDGGLFKQERVLTSPQSAHIDTEAAGFVNMCANNYLGLANHPRVIAAAKNSFEHYGYGLSSVRFICGTQSVHKQLEAKLSEFLGMEDTILYSSCFDANGGLFETLLTDQDAVFSDELNHASIIDGIRLCKAKRYRYKNNDCADLEAKLKEAGDARIRLIATDGVFSMDGIIADLNGVCELAEKYDALVMVDDSHAVGVCGKTGRGSHEHCVVRGRVDIITGTLGKALGGASGGYTSASADIISLLRQRSRPYLFSNTLAPSIAAASIEVLDMLTESLEFKEKLDNNTAYFREKMSKAGFILNSGGHPIVPIILNDERLTQRMAAKLFEKGVYAVGFVYPVVPKGKARVRTQVSAAHSFEDLDFAVEAFVSAMKEVNE